MRAAFLGCRIKLANVELENQAPFFRHVTVMSFRLGKTLNAVEVECERLIEEKCPVKIVSN
jgi:hypothetical protein